MVQVSLKVLDRSRPYAEVHGLPGAAYEQDGICFKPDGHVSEGFSPINDADPYPLQDDSDVGVGAAQEISGPEPLKDRPASFEDMHWKHLKVLVESFGGEWTDKSDALEFLRGRKT